MANKCPKCNSDNTSDSKFCKECGTQLFPYMEAAEITKTLETPREELTRGTIFANRYEIIEELGRGGMGRVYRVDDTKVREEVALKLIKPEVAADKRTIDRFRNELKSARKIRHKNVSGMYDLGEYEGIHFITMEYVTGEDLKSFLRRSKQISIPTAISIAKQVCEGLVEAHKFGIVHRDLKPSNIMIDKAGNARIMDFGIARSVKGEPLTGENVIVGTPDYMSPEQVEGKEIDQRSDIYSLGVVLFEMLTGERPFKGDTSLSVAMKHKAESPPNPKWLNDQIPDHLSRLVLMCLEKDKEKRYQSAEELLSALENIDKKKLQLADIEEEKKSIAVLPFINMSADPEQEYFCDGISEDIINSLTQIKDLRVVARTSAFSFKGKSVDIKEIGRKLDVNKVLEGSVRKAGNRLRITAQLINVADGYHIWSEQYNRDLEDVFAIQDAITQAIVDKLKVKLLRKEKESIVKRYTEDVEAYNLYLKGRHFSLMFTKDGIKNAIKIFEQSLAKDPEFPLAYAGIADAYFFYSYFGDLPPMETVPKAKGYLKMALDLDEGLAEAHATLGRIITFYDWNYEEAEQQFRRALDLNPNAAIIHFHYSSLLMVQGRYEESILEVKKARELDPLSVRVNAIVGERFIQAGQFDLAIDDLRRTIKMAPNDYYSHFLLGYAYQGKFMLKEAIAALEKASALSGGLPLVDALLAISCYQFGKKDQGDKLFKSIMEREKREYVPPVFIFWLHKARGNKELAYEWLEKACEERDIMLPFVPTNLIETYYAPLDSKSTELLRKYRLIR